MAGAVGDLQTRPASVLIFSGPFEAGRKCNSTLTLTNMDDKPVAFLVKAVHKKPVLELMVTPKNGELEPGQTTTLTVVCAVRGPGADQNISKEDKVFLEWCHRPSDAGPNTPFNLEWFQGDGIIRRKNFKVDYNI